MTREQVWGFACVWLHYTGRDSQLDRLSASLLGRGQVSVLRRSVCSACTCAQCVADPAAPRPCSVTALNHHDLDMGARRCLQEIGRIWEQNQPWGQFLLLRSFSSKTQASQWDTWRSSWAVLLQPACEDAGSGLSSPIHGLEVDVALSLEQKRSCNTIYSSFFFCNYFLSSRFALCHFLICIAKIQHKCFKFPWGTRGTCWILIFHLCLSPVSWLFPASLTQEDDWAIR